MIRHSPVLSSSQGQSDHPSKPTCSLAFVIITRNRAKSIKRLVESILKAELQSLFLVLVDDSDPANFRKTGNFLRSSPLLFRQLSSGQAGRLVEETLRDTSLTEREKSFIRSCTGLLSPFCGFVEQFLESGVKKGLIGEGLSFAPYSVARNLGIYCAVRFSRPDIVFFLDDDCEILHPEKLRDQIMLLHTTLNRKRVLASSGLYRDPEQSHYAPHFSEKVLRTIRGMDTFLKKAFAVGRARFEIMPPHLLGGVLILSKSVFSTLPFDPYVARGEDHAYALDLKSLLSEDAIYVRDNHFIVGHRKRALNPVDAKMNTLRDIFRFVYIRRKTGRAFISFFAIRWVFASLISLFLSVRSCKQCRRELWALLFTAPRFAKINAHKFRRDLPAWNGFLRQLN
jgi:glycosyltransferase involved in cell wall biosynthesis